MRVAHFSARSVRAEHVSSLLARIGFRLKFEFCHNTKIKKWQNLIDPDKNNDSSRLFSVYFGVIESTKQSTPFIGQFCPLSAPFSWQLIRKCLSRMSTKIAAGASLLLKSFLGSERTSKGSEEVSSDLSLFMLEICWFLTLSCVSRRFVYILSELLLCCSD